jgi:hypothetical protein
VQFVHGNLVKAAQKDSGRRRTRAEKVGRLQYILERIRLLEGKIGQIDLRRHHSILLS